MGWIQDLWNISYPSLTTQTPFKPQKFLFNDRALGSNIYSNQKEINCISPLSIRASVEVHPPKLHIYPNSPPFHPWHFMGLPPSFCDTRISSLRNKLRLPVETTTKWQTYHCDTSFSIHELPLASQSIWALTSSLWCMLFHCICSLFARLQQVHVTLQ